MLKCGLLGRKLGHSYSPAIHGMLSDYSYQLFEREPEELEDFLLRGDWDGINVTIPYKKSVLPLLPGTVPPGPGAGQREHPGPPPGRQPLRGQHRRLRL